MVGAVRILLIDPQEERRRVLARRLRAPGETLESLIDRADRAMYASKAAGRNRVTRCATEIGNSLYEVA